jgi:hypothetical protein
MSFKSVRCWKNGRPASMPSRRVSAPASCPAPGRWEGVGYITGVRQRAHNKVIADRRSTVSKDAAEKETHITQQQSRKTSSPGGMARLG